MIAEHQNDRRLLLLAEVIDQFLEGGVRLLDEREVLLSVVVGTFWFGDVHGGLVIAVVIAAVILHGHVKHEHLFAGHTALVQIDDLAVALAVTDIVADLLGRGLLLFEVVDAVEAIEAQQRIDVLAVPPLGVIGVDG